MRKKEIGLEDGQFDIIPKELKNYGAHCGNLVLIINELCKILTKQNYLNKVSQYNHIIYYKDFNTNKLFKKDKTLKLYLLHILSNINYVYYVLRKYEVKDIGWWLKIYYITYYYAIVRIESIKEYISTQKQSKSYLNTKPNISLSNNRLHKLELIKSKELQDVKRLLIENKKCGYQENNLLSIEEFIRIKLGEEKLKS